MKKLAHMFAWVGLMFAVAMTVLSYGWILPIRPEKFAQDSAELWLYAKIGYAVGGVALIIYFLVRGNDDPLGIR